MNSKNDIANRVKSVVSQILGEEFTPNKINTRITQLSLETLEMDCVEPLDSVTPIMSLINHIMENDFDGNFSSVMRSDGLRLNIEHMISFRFISFTGNIALFYIIIDKGAPFEVRLSLTFDESIIRAVENQITKEKDSFIELQRELFYETYMEHKVQEQLIELL